MDIQKHIENHRTNRKKMLALLIDPDKCHGKQLDIQIESINQCRPQLILVGGSLTSYPVDDVVKTLKEKTDLPVVLYPGHPVQISFAADALLFLSMISGRNAELLIGAHVTAAPAIHKNGIETIPTGYMLIDGGTPTSVEYISQTQPIPAQKTDIALATALAGQMLGLKIIYMDAGSGATKPIPPRMIEKVKENLSIPLMVGGGIDTPEKLKNAYESGADIVVVGNALEKSPELLQTFTEITDHS